MRISKKFAGASIGKLIFRRHGTMAIEGVQQLRVLGEAFRRAACVYAVDAPFGHAYPPFAALPLVSLPVGHYDAAARAAPVQSQQQLQQLLVQQQQLLQLQLQPGHGPAAAAAAPPPPADAAQLQSQQQQLFQHYQQLRQMIGDGRPRGAAPYAQPQHAALPQQPQPQPNQQHHQPPQQPQPQPPPPQPQPPPQPPAHVDDAQPFCDAYAPALPKEASVGEASSARASVNDLYHRAMQPWAFNLPLPLPLPPPLAMVAGLGGPGHDDGAPDSPPSLRQRLHRNTTFSAFGLAQPHAADYQQSPPPEAAVKSSQAAIRSAVENFSEASDEAFVRQAAAGKPAVEAALEASVPDSHRRKLLAQCSERLRPAAGALRMEFSEELVVALTRGPRAPSREPRRHGDDGDDRRAATPFPPWPRELLPESAAELPECSSPEYGFSSPEAGASPEPKHRKLNDGTEAPAPASARGGAESREVQRSRQHDEMAALQKSQLEQQQRLQQQHASQQQHMSDVSFSPQHAYRHLGAGVDIGLTRSQWLRPGAPGSEYRVGIFKMRALSTRPQRSKRPRPAGGDPPDKRRRPRAFSSPRLSDCSH
ncbi:hypothetical protein M885DRAFT_156526 [Pelagophyceae sp. CCMP2097]|nr:hypothetical protein M885DRAFT_156526 [Pelagophyceae sp. CCMP2097]